MWGLSLYKLLTSKKYGKKTGASRGMCDALYGMYGDFAGGTADVASMSLIDLN